MAKKRWKLTDSQWEKIEPLLPKPKMSRHGGRPGADNRKVFEGILWILRTGAPWADLPKQYPSPSTCWRRPKLWEQQDVWLNAWRLFLSELDEREDSWTGPKHLSTAVSHLQKRGDCVGKTKRGKGTKWMVVVDGEGIPLRNHLDSASPNEGTLPEKTIENIAVSRKGRGRPKRNPRRLIADRGYDSDPLHQRLAQKGIELICPYRSNNKGQKYYDGRKLRRYKKQWKVERTFSWLGNNRRLVIRWDRDITVYKAFFHIACLIITL